MKRFAIAAAVIALSGAAITSTADAQPMHRPVALHGPMHPAHQVCTVRTVKTWVRHHPVWRKVRTCRAVR